MNLSEKRKKRKYSSSKNAMLCMVKIGGDQRKGEPMIIKWLFTRSLWFELKDGFTILKNKRTD